MAPKKALTNQLTKSIKKLPGISLKISPPNWLNEIVAVWAELPVHIKAAIKALVQTHIQGD